MNGLADSDAACQSCPGVFLIQCGERCRAWSQDPDPDARTPRPPPENSNFSSDIFADGPNDTEIGHLRTRKRSNCRRHRKPTSARETINTLRRARKRNQRRIQYVHHDEGAAAAGAGHAPQRYGSRTRPSQDFVLNRPNRQTMAHSAKGLPAGLWTQVIREADAGAGCRRSGEGQGEGDEGREGRRAAGQTCPSTTRLTRSQTHMDSRDAYKPSRIRGPPRRSARDTRNSPRRCIRSESRG